MAGSNWNAFLDRLLAEKLTVAEYRLALALARNLYGWKRTRAHLGRALLRDASGLSGRSFERARDALIEKGLLHYVAGGVGRGNRGYYELIAEPLEKAAPQRAIAAPEKAAPGRPNQPAQKAVPQRPKASARKGRSGDAEKAALQRPRRGISNRKTVERKTIEPQLLRDAIDEYRNHGGRLELSDRKPTLLRQVRVLALEGHDHHLILAACADLGRTNTFPGFLKQRVDELQAEGGPCAWPGFDRAQLTETQLRECGCTPCTEWANTKATAGASA